MCVSVVGYLWAARYVFRECIDTAFHLDWEEVGIIGMIALMAGVFFPLVVLFVIARATIGRHDPRRFARVVGGESRATKLKRREREVAEREDRIARLEREVGVEQ